MRNVWTILILAGMMLAGGWYFGSSAKAAGQDTLPAATSGYRFEIYLAGEGLPRAFLLDRQTGDTWRWTTGPPEWQYHALPKRINGCVLSLEGCSEYSPVR